MKAVNNWRTLWKKKKQEGLRWTLKVSTDDGDLIKRGNAFQSLGAATENVQSSFPRVLFSAQPRAAGKRTREGQCLWEGEWELPDKEGPGHEEL